MELCLACLPLVTLLTLLTSEVKPSLAQNVYTNTWAVHISGGVDEANRIAQKHGFINHGNVQRVKISESKGSLNSINHSSQEKPLHKYSCTSFNLFMGSS
ncbi:furin (paired basic amino acid cleaving enzyme) a [Tachysurus ichikawai]